VAWQLLITFDSLTTSVPKGVKYLNLNSFLAIGVLELGGPSCGTGFGHEIWGVYRCIGVKSSCDLENDEQYLSFYRFAVYIQTITKLQTAYNFSIFTCMK